MSKTFLSFHKVSGLLIGLAVAGGCLTVGVRAASAQQGVDPLDANNERTSDPFSSTTEDNNYSPFFNIMHRMQLGNIRSVSEFGQDQQENLGSEATDFRTRQRALIQEQGQPNPTETLVPSAAPASPGAPAVSP
jgi:hypothetical protein